MLEFIVKYWVQFAFGIVAMGLTGLCKYFYGLYKKEKSHQKTKEQQDFFDSIKTTISEEHKNTIQVIEAEKGVSIVGDKILQEQIDVMKTDVATLKDGILSIQGRDFKQDCRFLLRPEHEITLDEYEQIQCDHEVYNSLGGNHKGDELFELVTTKFESGLTNKKNKGNE